MVGAVGVERVSSGPSLFTGKKQGMFALLERVGEFQTLFPMLFQGLTTEFFAHHNSEAPAPCQGICSRDQGRIF